MALILFSCGTFFNCKSQQISNYWNSRENNKGSIVLHKNSQRDNFPKKFKLFELNLVSFKQTIFQAVESKKEVQIILPNLDGEYETFSVSESSSFSQIGRAHV